ncbi:rhodanese-like domain-containing protein [Alkaliphilus serpentinus]|uniref:Rhodanese-like domain-containing protein n=1 Tax=Alkaliphilus serpentinus TaxID=1482731 RepID=A0A833HQH1_9FIRM|nr:rhodanese-like domain-containing protein [Alkaliphilus serpentinus]KAB3531828.1 rhodanese-like domain-containing protein [Alkaliphilus serpentinus]
MRIYVFKLRHIHIVAFLLILLILATIFLWQYTKDRAVSNMQFKYTFQQLLPEEAHQVINNNPDVIIIDIRERNDYEKGHIRDATAIPYKELKASLDQWNTDSTYLIYCNNGKDSMKASKLMAESGFPRVFTIVGGYKNWPYGIDKIH